MTDRVQAETTKTAGAKALQVRWAMHGCSYLLWRVKYPYALFNVALVCAPLKIGAFKLLAAASKFMYESESR